LGQLTLLVAFVIFLAMGGTAYGQTTPTIPSGSNRCLGALAEMYSTVKNGPFRVTSRASEKGTRLNGATDTEIIVHYSGGLKLNRAGGLLIGVVQDRRVIQEVEATYTVDGRIEARIPTEFLKKGKIGLYAVDESQNYDSNSGRNFSFNWNK
jgi:hypothetical protein